MFSCIFIQKSRENGQSKDINQKQIQCVVDVVEQQFFGAQSLGNLSINISLQKDKKYKILYLEIISKL